VIDDGDSADEPLHAVGETLTRAKQEFGKTK